MALMDTGGDTMGKPFNFLQVHIIKVLAEGLFHGVTMEIPPSRIVDNLQTQFAKVKGSKPREIGLTLVLLWLVIGGPFYSMASTGNRVQRIEKRLRRSRINFVQDLARLKAIIIAGYYGNWEVDNTQNPVLQGIGFTFPTARVRTDPKDHIKQNPLERDLPDNAFVTIDTLPDEIDIIVIGSGAGGAVAAAALSTQHHHKVLIIEAGDYYPSSKITHFEADMTARLYVDGALQSSRDNDIIVFQARCVGGGTVLNNGICLPVKRAGETHPAAKNVLAAWADLGAPIDEAALNRAYQKVENRLDVVRIDPRTGRNNGPHLLDGWREYLKTSTDPHDADAPHNWFRKNYGVQTDTTACVFCGYCNTGCPYGRKRAMPQTFLMDATTLGGARILTGARVHKIGSRANTHTGERVARSVDVVLADGTRKTIHARKGVVVAAGALESSRLLQRSGIENAGHDISLNIACPVPALMPAATVKAWDEDQMATYIDRGDFLIESHFQPPMSMSVLIPGWFGEHFARMRNMNRITSAGVLFPADRCGRLVNGKLRFKLRATHELPLLRKALATLSEIHFKNGALEVYPALARGLTLKPCSRAEIDAFYEAHVQEADDVTLSSSHPHGGNPIHTSAYLGIVDPQLKVHGFANMYVTDASVFPACIRVNAQMTTMAMSHYAMWDADPFRQTAAAEPAQVA
jgi:choline dehydrogenase-like flavoprotein